MLWQLCILFYVAESNNDNWPMTQLHYSSGCHDGCNLGFNLADVQSVNELNELPNGILGLVWLGLCNGTDSTFISMVKQFQGNKKLYGFYLMDEPDPTGTYAPLCPVQNLKQESDWIHSTFPSNVKTFIVMMNFGSPEKPTYNNTYNPKNTGIDLYGLDPYPIRSQFPGGEDYNVIPAAVNAALATGIQLDQIIPLYQAFGGGGYSSWTVPNTTQVQTYLELWATLTPTPVFDYVYAWSSQQNDTALSELPDLQVIFEQKNADIMTSSGVY